MFEQLSDKLEGIFKRLRGQSQLTEENVSETLREIRVVLLSADVNFKTVKDFINTVKEKAIGAEVLTSLSPGQVMVKVIHDELVALLGGQAEEPAFQGSPPFQILMMGLQGSGKTTACGKLALHLRNTRKKNPLLVACDVYRPAAIDQLKTIGKSLGIPVYDEGLGDPVTIAENGRKFAANGLQIAAGVPLQVGEGAGFRTFRLGLFGLDKLADVDATLARLTAGIDRAMAPAA